MWKASALGFMLNATVPGSIYMDLMLNHVIEDPYARYNDIAYSKYASFNWSYTRTFQEPVGIKNYTNVVLACDGLDTVSELFLNNQTIGKSWNQFVKYRFDVKDLIRPGVNVIEVRFISAISYASVQSVAYPYPVPPECPPDVQHGQCHPNFIRKEQASFSWDWGPSFPSQGIWKDMRLEAYNDLELTGFSAEIAPSDDGKEWLVHIVGSVAGVNSLTSTEKYLFVAVLEDTGINQTLDVTFSQGSTDRVNVTLTFDKQLVKLWWPNGYGAQPLYNLSISLSRDEPIWIRKRVGFRTIELVQEPISGAKGLSFYFKINGRPIFMKGSNWIPADSFQSRITSKKIKDLLNSARLAHMNMLRVWGGGIYERDIFYDLADEMGIIIWQDIMFACAMYPTNTVFLENVTLEVTQQVSRLKHHPSLGLWAGNNENEAALRDNWYNTTGKFDLYKADYIKLYIDTVMAAVYKEHPSGIFVSSSPSNAAQSEKEGWIALNPYDTRYGDVHYYNYTPGRYYVDTHPRSRFLSEYGYQSWPSTKSLVPLTLPADLFEFSNFAFYRNHHGSGQEQMNAQIRYYFNKPNASLIDPVTNFTHYVYLTQINQAMYIRMVSEFCRRSQSYLYGDDGLTMGALYWQLNDIWPGPSWSSLEYSGKWKMLHYYAKKFFAPEMISMSIEADNLTIYVVMDSDNGFPYNLTLYCFSWDSYEAKYEKLLPVKLKQQTSNLIFNENLDDFLKKANCTSREKHFLYAEWKGMVGTELPLSTYRTAVGLRKPTIKVLLAGSYPLMTMILTTDAIAPFVWLDTDVEGVLFEDNGFLFVGDTKVLLVTLRYNATVKASDIKIMSLMDLYDIYN
ncbi:beta-mannosidase-like [Watersipora subatra]|uniref:beta-mannosidase-like n=1 Tax=Watersipora subatra TaxID=2589382 RepID=UPI00355BEDBB